MTGVAGVRQTSDWPSWTCPTHGVRLQAGSACLLCPQGHSFPIAGGIPRFVAADNYAAHFGAQWKRYRLTQHDSFTGLPISETRLRRSVGEELWHGLGGLSVLECGCGAGRFTEVLLARGARLMSVDLSDAVEVNAQTCPPGEMHRVAQADLRTLPFEPRQFDVVLCLGVLQHTPSPEAAIAALYDQVKPGGFLVIDHYTYSLGWYTKTAPLFRMVLKRLPPDRAMRFTETLVDRLLPLHKRAARSRLRSIVGRLSPVLTHYVTYPELSDEIQRQWALLDTHDSLTDWYKHFRTRGQIERGLRALGACNISSAYAGNGVEARAQRPRS